MFVRFHALRFIHNNLINPFRKHYICDFRWIFIFAYQRNKVLQVLPILRLFHLFSFQSACSSGNFLSCYKALFHIYFQDHCYIYTEYDIILKGVILMDIFNTKILNNRQRWNRACFFAVLGTVLSIIVCALLQRFLIHSALFYLAAAYLLGWLILETGHGVQKKFSVLAAICVVCVIIFGDIFASFGLAAFKMPLLAIQATFSSYVSISFNSLLSLFLKISAVGIAYNKARIL